MSSPAIAKLKNDPGMWAKVALGISLLISLVFVFGFVFPYYRLTPEAFGPYLSKRGWLLTHISMGTIALLLGPFVLGLGLGRRSMLFHRRLGYTYMSAIALSSIAAFYLATHTELGWVFGTGLIGLAIAWISTTGLAFLAIRRRNVLQHKEWMIRSYVATAAFVNFRILAGILGAAHVGTLVEQLSAASWFCWAVPLLITELILQGRKVFGARIAA
jgi:hypothetical protein